MVSFMFAKRLLWHRRALVAALVVVGVIAIARPCAAISAQADVFGTVTGDNGVPVSGAAVSIIGSGRDFAAITASNGTFHLTGVTPGTYSVRAGATGYVTLSGRTIDVAADKQTVLDISLSRGQVSSVVVIGDVKVDGSATLSSAPAPTAHINAQAYAAQGVSRVSDILTDALSTTVYPVIGGGLNAPAVVALRGPDPAETLVDIDGHQVNNGNTGDFDLSLLDPAELQSVQIVYGIAPSALYGPNTLGGALNVQTVEPTSQDHDLERVTLGSYNTFGETLLGTGSDARWGYSFAVHRVTSGGELDDDAFPNSSNPATGATDGTSPIGDDMSATNDLAKLRYTFSNGGFAGVSFGGQTVYRDLSATLSSVQLPDNGAPFDTPFYSNFSGSAEQSNAAVYGLDLQLPLGKPGADGVTSTTAIFRHQTAYNAQTIDGPANGTSPYLFDGRDLIGDDTLEVDRVLSHAELSAKFAVTDEDLTTDFIPGVVYADDALRAPLAAAILAFPSQAGMAETGVDGAAPAPSTVKLGQTQRWAGLRYTLDPTAQLHYSLATYLSDYSTFGHSVDPRFGFVWTPTAATALRLSAGTTFQSPQLPTFLVPPVLPEATPCLIGYCVSVGNPKATAERSTNYDLGADHLLTLFGHSVHSAVDLYRTDLHDGVATQFEPLPASDSDVCPVTTCFLDFPTNVTREVYEGVELHADTQLAPDTVLKTSYDIDSVFTKGYPIDAADNVPFGEQSAGVPLHKAGIDIEHNPTAALTYYAGVLYEGEYNELDLPPFATLRAGVTWHLRGFDVGIAGENLTDADDFKITRINGGIVYGGLPPSEGGIGPAPTDAFPLPGRQITLILTRHV
ncbi:MAG TPA: TonB-dependent receptor [Candidatus Eremiobacteraceae bacterium]|nr:TonB-dependent receptor [Candidatus Eremiobacteraceae bacterium]